MILTHFTPARKAWSKTSPQLSTGNVESISYTGLRPFSSVAYDPVNLTNPDPEKLYAFAHHASRNNHKGLWGRKVIISAAVIFDAKPLYQQGYDGECHAQVNERLQPETIIGWFTFESLGDFTAKLDAVLACWSDRDKEAQ